MLRLATMRCSRVLFLRLVVYQRRAIPGRIQAHDIYLRVRKMQEDWKASIAKIAYWKQIINENDKLGAFPWHLPRVAASDARIAEAEAHIGASFSAPYRELLSLADGWRGFCVSTDLFGTEDFLGERAIEVRDRSDVQEYVFDAGLSYQDVVPVGASDADTDVFLLVSDASPQRAGEVIWLAGSEVDRYADFREFFEAMVNYNARLAQQLINQS